MKNNPFDDIKKKKKSDIDKNQFIESAKVDGPLSKKNTLDKNERRGSSYVDKETGKKINLSGKIIQVPVNGYELKIIENSAKKMGLTVASYLRTIGIERNNKD